MDERPLHVSADCRELAEKRPSMTVHLAFPRTNLSTQSDTERQIEFELFHVEPHGFIAVAPLVSSVKPADACPPSPRLLRTLAAHSSTA